MTFKERDQEAETNHGVPTTLATEETAEPTPLTEDEAETPEPIPEEAFTPLPARGEDPVRLYLKEIGKVPLDRKSTRLNSSHGYISYAVFCLKKKKKNKHY